MSKKDSEPGYPVGSRTERPHGGSDAWHVERQSGERHGTPPELPPGVEGFPVEGRDK